MTTTGRRRTTLSSLALSLSLVLLALPIASIPPALAQSGAGTSTLSVHSQTGRGFDPGFYAVLYQNGIVVSTGFTPVNFTLNDGQPYTIQVDSYDGCFFTQWQDTGNASASRSISITNDTSLTAVYSCVLTTNSVTVDSIDQNGNAIFGYYAALYNQNGDVIGTGFTTQTFGLGLINAVPPPTFSLEVGGYGGCIFSHWSDGVTNNPRQFAASGGPLAFTAVYNCSGGSASTSTINVLTVKGDFTPPLANVNGFYTTLWQNGVQVQSCFSPCSFAVSDGQTYQVAVSDYDGYRFLSWNDGSTNRFETVNVPSNPSNSTIDLMASYDPFISVQAVDQNGNPLTGYFTSFYACPFGHCSNSSQTAFTPATFSLFFIYSDGCKQFGETCTNSYAVSVGDYGACIFNHWQDTGSTNRMRDVSVSPPASVTAVYRCNS
jgi:hypothetical protein